MTFLSAPMLFVSAPAAVSRLFAPTRSSATTPLSSSSFVGGRQFSRIISRPALDSNNSVVNVPVRQTPQAATTTSYRIYVENESPYPSNFFVFQQPAVYEGGPKVYSNSLGAGFLPAFDNSLDAQLSFSIDVQYLAGAQKQMGNLEVGEMQVGKVSMAKVKLHTESDDTMNTTSMSIDTYGMPDLSLPKDGSDVQNGAFRIVTPAYLPGEGPFNIGTAVVANDVLTMSNFISAVPAQNLDVQPIVKFYIATGDFIAGQIVNFTKSSVKSAVCDATSGQTKFTVVYKPNGTFGFK